MGMGEGRVTAGSGYVRRSDGVVLVGMASQAATRSSLGFLFECLGVAEGWLYQVGGQERRQWGWNRQVFAPRLGCRE